MEKHRDLPTPYGEASLTFPPGWVRIQADGGLAGDWALGWWHGHACGEEAAFARAFWRGTLGSEARPSTARGECDAFVARWSFGSDLALETARLSGDHRARITAYCQGFNQGWKHPPKVTPWTPEDCHLLARTLGFLEWWETRAPQVAFLLEALPAGLAWDKILDLWPGLGSEPDRAFWKGLTLPVPFSPEARSLVNRLRRFRPGTVWTIPANRSTTGRPLLAATWASDVTEPGLPFQPVRIDTPVSSVRGLSRPGHPGFLAGRTANLAWAASPAVDDTIDLRVLERQGSRNLAGVWAGTGRTGTLQGLLELEGAGGVDQARERNQGLGSACLDFTAVDARGGVARWNQGPRWLRPSPRDGWLPAAWGSEIPVGPRRASPEEAGPPGRLAATDLERWITLPHPLNLDSLMAPLRFLLPDSEEGQALRRWSGLPPRGPEATAFDRLQSAVLGSFWETSPLVPAPGSPLVQTLVGTIDRLLQAPHSFWWPSAEKNRRLGEAVRRAFGPGGPPGAPGLARRAVRSLWTEELGGKPRIFAATVALVVDPGEPGWRVFLTDDETEEPRFLTW